MVSQSERSFDAIAIGALRLNLKSVNFVMTRMVYHSCPKCGAEIPAASASSEYREEDGVLLVHYDPRCKSVVLINAESGLRNQVNLSGAEQTPKPASRQIGGIIGPY
jgi:hypothetical protein